MIGVYGANGFMGKHLVRRLAARGCSVRAVARQFDPEFLHSCPGSVEFVEADLRNLAATAASLRGVDALIQLASTSTPAMENGRTVRDIEENVLPHVAFMQAAADHGVRRYVFVSSGGTVYGPGSPVPTPEHAVTRPMCSYGLTKITIENYLRMYAVASDMEAVVLRVANAFGPEQAFRKGQGLIPAVLGRLAEGLPVHIVGDGRAVRDYVFIDDVIDAFEAALEKPLAGGGTFNVGSGQGQTVIEVVDAIEHAVGARIERVHVPSRSTDMDVSILDITAAVTGLGWHPRTRFADGLLRTVCWWRDMIKVRDRRAA